VTAAWLRRREPGVRRIFAIVDLGSFLLNMDTENAISFEPGSFDSDIN
jgi:hypothetical protein